MNSDSYYEKLIFLFLLRSFIIIKKFRDEYGNFLIENYTLSLFSNLFI